MPSLRDAPPAPPGAGPCRDRLVETDRLEWRLGEGGDPAALAEDFCRTHAPGPHTGEDGTPCGVALLVSAAAGAAMAGAATGPPSPAPAVPDLALIAYRHGRPRRRAPGPAAVGPWTPTWTGADHAKAVTAVQEAIGRGQVYVANVVGHRTAPWSGDPHALAAAVTAVPGAAWAGTIAGEGWLVASASPEAFLTADLEQGTAATHPIKGTAPATAAGRTALLESVKERAEHTMIVDLARNDLARVAEPGTVRVEHRYRLREWSGLWQAESAVACDLAPGTGLADLLRATCPPGSVTGTPKLAVLDLTAALEPVGRGPAMGALGYLQGPRLRLAVTIRTLALDQTTAHLWSGGGITWRSDPDAETREADAKAAALTRALDPA